MVFFGLARVPRLDCLVAAGLADLDFGGMTIAGQEVAGDGGWVGV